MPLGDISLADWARMSDEVARRECEALARGLPHGLRLTGLDAHVYCGRAHRVARFSRREGGDVVHFVLVPGGEVSLGFDGASFRPSRWQLKSFMRTTRAFDFDPSIERLVDLQTSSPRMAFIEPMLIEVEAQEIAPREDAELIDRSDPMFESFKDEHPENGRAVHWGGVLGEDSYIVERDGDGALRVFRRSPTTVHLVQERLRRNGMRLLTCDEWEHACGAGATTLFRWGDDTPHDFYPCDTCAEDAALKRAWAMSLGKLAYETPPAQWDLHEQLNLFGLRIANDPYRMDIVSDGPQALGGDGGCNICGGAGFFLGWLPLATAFRDPNRGPMPPDKNVADKYHRLRRVIPLN